MEHGEVRVLAYFPANKDPSEPIHPAVRPLNDPAARSNAGFALELLCLLAAAPEMKRESKGDGERARLLVVVSLVEAKPLRVAAVGRGRGTGMLSIVSAISLWSFLFAPSTVSPTGTPAPSVSRLRFVPRLARSVGLGPVFFPAQRSLRHRAVHRQPFPVDPFGLVVGQEPLAPELVKHSCVEPFAKPPVGRGARADPRGVKRIPLAASPKHEEDSVHRVAIGDARIVAAERMLRPGR